MSKYMFDTNIYNRLLDGYVDIAILREKACYATHIQLDEIQATRDSERRSQLTGVFSEIQTRQIPTESTVWDISRWDMAKFGDGEKYGQILLKLDARNKKKANNVQDALIAETALLNGLVLVTEDKDLAAVVTELGGIVCDLRSMLT